MLMMLMVEPITSRPSITPMSESGSDSMIANGSRNEPNCTTRTKYISSTASPSDAKIWPKTLGLVLALAAEADAVALAAARSGRIAP